MLNLLFVSCALMAHGVTDVDSPTPALPEVAPPPTRARVRWLELDDDVTSPRRSIADAVFAGDQLVVTTAMQIDGRSWMTTTAHDIETGDRRVTMARVDPPVPDAIFDQVGVPLAGNGRVIVGAARLHGGSGDDAGAVYVFDQATGAVLHTLEPAEPIRHMAFGGVVALQDERIAVRAMGLPRAPGPASYTGTTEIFDLTTGERIAAVSDPMPSHRSIGALAWHGTELAVGLPGAEAPHGTLGAIWIIDTATGEVTDTILPPAPIGKFGSSVALSEHYVVIGAVEGHSNSTGHAFRYDRQTNTLHEIAAPPGAKSFGRHIAFLDTHHVVITANHATRESVYFAGNAWVFDLRTGATVGRPLGELTSAVGRQGFGKQLVVTPTHVLIGMSWRRDPDGTLRPSTETPGTFLVIERAALLPPPE